MRKRFLQPSRKNKQEILRDTDNPKTGLRPKAESPYPAKRLEP
jgi:hypothetical protein